MTKQSYEEWLKKNNLHEAPDYNMHDAWLSGLQPDERGHLPDTFKMPNHITYSDESVYAKQKGAPPPGRWSGDDKTGWTFYASPTNIKNAGGEQGLKDYFQQYEPDSHLVLPETPNALQGLIQ